jgi:hypothetical protein
MTTTTTTTTASANADCLPRPGSSVQISLIDSLILARFATPFSPQAASSLAAAAAVAAAASNSSLSSVLRIRPYMKTSDLINEALRLFEGEEMQVDNGNDNEDDEEMFSLSDSTFANHSRNQPRQ